MRLKLNRFHGVKTRRVEISYGPDEAYAAKWITEKRRRQRRYKGIPGFVARVEVTRRIDPRFGLWDAVRDRALIDG